MSTYIYVFQEWDILKQHPKDVEQKVERTTGSTSQRPSFGFLLQQARIRKRMTTMDVANALNLASKVVTLYENGTEIPSSQTASEMRTLLDF